MKIVASLAEGHSTANTIILLVLVVILGTSSAFILHWKFGEEESEHKPSDLETLELSPILYTDKDKYHIGDPVQVEIALRNGESEKVELRGIEYNLTIYEDDREIYWMRVQYDFTKPAIIEPYDTYWVQVGQTWKQRDIMNQPVPAGTYVLIMKLLPYNLTTSKIIIVYENG